MVRHDSSAIHAECEVWILWRRRTRGDILQSRSRGKRYVKMKWAECLPQYRKKKEDTEYSRWVLEYEPRRPSLGVACRGKRMEYQ